MTIRCERCDALAFSPIAAVPECSGTDKIDLIGLGGRGLGFARAEMRGCDAIVVDDIYEDDPEHVTHSVTSG
jgi:hypothetical protein